MFKYLVISIRRRFIVYLLLAAIFLALGGGYSGSKVMTQGIVMSAQEDLEQYWRWQYDILVYPKESQEYQGLGDGWVAPQTSLASYGGISLEDWETIKQIKGVEVAAPLSLIGYMDYDKVSATYEPVEAGEIYLTEHVKKVFDGLREVELWSERLYREYKEPNDESFFWFENFVSSRVSDKNKAIPQNLRTPNKLMIVAVDPQAEERLYRLSEAIVEGEDLLFTEVVHNQALNQPVIPVIALYDLGIQAEESVHVYRVEPPEDNDSWRESDHPADYLDIFQGD